MIKTAGKYFSLRHSTDEEKGGEKALNRKISNILLPVGALGFGTLGGGVSHDLGGSKPVIAASVLGGALAYGGLDYALRKVTNFTVDQAGARVHFEPLVRRWVKHYDPKDKDRIY